MKKERFGRAIIIVGMQYGSEGKGSITSYLSPIVSLGARSGASNAGHTIYFNGRKFIMRQIPSVWVNSLAKLVIGRGALISPDILFKEIELVEKFLPVRNRLFIDTKAHVITKEQIENEKKTDLAERIASTSARAGEGIGSSASEKVLRKASCVQAKDDPRFKDYLCDTVDMINDYLDNDEFILLEGTQGIGLSLEHGEFPFVTSRDTSATALAASVGLSTHEFDVDVIGVTRAFPIRVAGNSGPFDNDSEEITWQKLAKMAGAKNPITEKTSVTGKTRRVATFSWDGFLKACQINRPTEIALTFADYLDWSVRESENTSKKVDNFIKSLEETSGVPVTLIKTGSESIIDRDWYRSSRLDAITI